MTTKRASLTKAGVFPYLIEGRIQPVLRHPDDVLAPSAIASMRSLPVTDGHPAINGRNVSVHTFDSLDEVVIGSSFTVEADVDRQTAEVYGTLQFTRDRARDLYESGQRDISMGYHRQLVADRGDFMGKKYTHKYTNLVYDHTAMVPRGNLGTTMIVDSAEEIEGLIVCDHASLPLLPGYDVIFRGAIGRIVEVWDQGARGLIQVGSDRLAVDSFEVTYPTELIGEGERFFSFTEARTDKRMTTDKKDGGITGDAPEIQLLRDKNTELTAQVGILQDQLNQAKTTLAADSQTAADQEAEIQRRAIALATDATELGAIAEELGIEADSASLFDASTHDDLRRKAIIKLAPTQAEKAAALTGDSLRSVLDFAIEAAKPVAKTPKVEGDAAKGMSGDAALYTSGGRINLSRMTAASGGAGIPDMIKKLETSRKKRRDRRSSNATMQMNSMGGY